MNRYQQRHGHTQPQNPAQGGKHRHVHVVEHEHLIAEHRQPVEIIRTLVMGDGNNRCLELRDVRFQRNRDLVAEAALHARADRAQKPRRRRGDSEADCRAPHQTGPVLKDSLTQQHQPQCEQRIGQRSQL